MAINELCERAHKNASKKGFWDDIHALDAEEGISVNEMQMYYNNAYAARLALIHSEVSEALEALRTGETELEKEELADIVIRVMDYCGGKGIDLEAEILDKMDRNEKRGHKHGKAF